MRRQRRNVRRLRPRWATYEVFEGTAEIEHLVIARAISGLGIE